MSLSNSLPKTSTRQLRSRRQGFLATAILIGMGLLGVGIVAAWHETGHLRQEGRDKSAISSLEHKNEKLEKQLADQREVMDLYRQGGTPEQAESLEKEIADRDLYPQPVADFHSPVSFGDYSPTKEVFEQPAVASEPDTAAEQSAPSFDGFNL